MVRGVLSRPSDQLRYRRWKAEMPDPDTAIPRENDPDESGLTTLTTGDVLGAEGAVPGAARRGGDGGGTPP